MYITGEFLPARKLGSWGICLQILKSGDYGAVFDKEGGCDLESGSFMLDRFLCQRLEAECGKGACPL